ncbi:hypothetical protein CEE37_00620 [candidate division LCP-89 bacterium B3_LCP]|uniref:M23ase beta-sheet core domain-containing protein n=1 Tax=candidate division LCP-89 bacterium B3_LCP TaxID=2012998 RepID=A0A532V4Z9_UNCL8|nr:MAG: hypothetical protein CEE37_00620 [candidate division LCP-89 bacterium B3_LCP]
MFVTCLVLLLPGLSGGEVPQDEVQQASEQLQRIRDEIEQYEKRIKESQTREKDLLSELENYDREISLRRSLVNTLERELIRTQHSLKKILADISNLQVKIELTRSDSAKISVERDSLASIVTKRAVYAYKYLRRDVLQAILTSRSLVQMLTRQEYLQRITEADRKNLQRLDQKNQQLSKISRTLEDSKIRKSEQLHDYRKTAQFKEKLIRDESTETENLAERRKERESLLAQIRQDQDLLRRQLAEKKLAAERVENMIRDLETRRETLPILPERTWAPDVPFAQLKGRLNWPAIGKVVSKFGPQRHQTLATITENPGIEIEAGEGTPVHTVGTGQVTRITWLRGYGNTVIVDHSEGYYTVYAHMGQILVREGQVIDAGEVIGRVGQTGSLQGPRLHFEIWAKREKQDPQSWLIRK